jgi:hypothetical protein
MIFVLGKSVFDPRRSESSRAPFAAALRFVVGSFVATACILAPVLRAQDYSVLRINEVIAENDAEAPTDVNGSFTDLVEIWNTGTEQLRLGFDSAALSIGVSDSRELPVDGLWTFRSGVSIRPGESVLVFADGNTCQNDCESHASFRIDSNGSEPLTLWGPVVDGVRQVIDQVWLPPLPRNSSFGRRPNGAGPAPVPVGETFEHFDFFPPGTTTFGGCRAIPSTTCAASCGPFERRFCEGDPNPATGVNLPPSIERLSHSTNAPAAGEEVRFVVEVRDDELPTPGNIARAELVYRVDGGSENVVDFVWDEATGVLPNLEGLEPGDPDFPSRPLDRRTRWSASIPGLPAGSRVEFSFRVVDRDGLGTTRPEILCAPGVGPCDVDFGGDAACEFDPASTSCAGALVGVRYIPCDAWFRFVVGYAVPAGLEGLVINEVMASQTRTLMDPSASATHSVCQGADPAPYCCLGVDGAPPPADCGFEDFIEIFNSGESAIDLGGLWLSNSYFTPRGWNFPAEAVLPAGEFAIVWLDGDGGKCPQPELPIAERPCFWECPDPNDLATQTYHANFSLDASSDQIFIFDRSDSGYGRIHGFEFRDQASDVSASLCPDGDPLGDFVATAEPTPRARNFETAECSVEPVALFRRGDAASDCGVDITDAIVVLQYLFLGGMASTCPDAADADDSGVLSISDPVVVLNFLFRASPPPAAPGPSVSGADPTPDELGDCSYPQNCGP